jgi:CoA:oxalate CoA-transferase
MRRRTGFIAIAMVNLRQLGDAIGSKRIAAYTQDEGFSRRDDIKRLLAAHLAERPTAYWLERLHEEDLWAMEVLDWEQMTRHEGYRNLGMEQTITAGGRDIVTTRCPIRINGERLYSPKPAPQLGEHNEKISKEFIK